MIWCPENSSSVIVYMAIEQEGGISEIIKLALEPL